MSIINDNIVSENLQENNNDNNVGRSICMYFLTERMFCLTSYFDGLGFEGERKKVYVRGEGSDGTNCFCCMAVLTILPEIIIDLVLLVSCFVPSLLADCCQGAIGNTTSLNMLMLEKKILRVNDEVIISNELTVDEVFGIQYKRGSLGQFLLNRKHYHHQASSNLIDPESRVANEKIHMFQTAGTKGRIVSIVDGGNIDVEFTINENVIANAESENDTPQPIKKVYRLSPLIVERVAYSDAELEIYESNKKHIVKGQWIETFGEIDETSKIDFESPAHPNYQTPTEKLIPCFACAGLILSLFCSVPSCFGCHLSGDILMLNNECTCFKVSRVQDKFCICCNANVSCIRPRSLVKCLYQCFCLDCRFKCPPWISENDKSSLRDFPCLCTLCGLTCCYQNTCYGPKLFRSVGKIRKDLV